MGVNTLSWIDWKSAVRAPPPPLPPPVTGLPLESSPLPFPAHPYSAAAVARVTTIVLYRANDISGAHEKLHSRRCGNTGPRFRQKGVFSALNLWWGTRYSHSETLRS